MSMAKAAGGAALRRTPRERLVRGGAWALIGRALTLPVGLATAMLLTRLLPPADVGAYFLAVSLAWLLAIVAQGGMARPMVKLIAAALATARPVAARRAVGIGVAVTAVGSLLLAPALADGPGRSLIRLLVDGERLSGLLVALALLMVAFAAIDLFAEALRGLHDLPSASLHGDLLLQRLLVALALAGLWLAWGRADLAHVVAATLLAATVALLAAGAVLWRRIGALGRDGSPWPVAEVLRHGPPFLAHRLGLWVLAGADLWILGVFRPAAEVALYGVASRLAAVVAVPIAVCNGALAPLAADAHGRGAAGELERLVRAAATLSAVPALLLAAAFWLLGDAVLRLAFTDRYAEAALILGVLALGRWLQVALGAAAVTLTMAGHQQGVMVITVLTSVATIAADVAVAPAFGALGVAVVTAGSLGISSALLAWLLWRRRGIRSWPGLSASEIGQLAAALRPPRRSV